MVRLKRTGFMSAHRWMEMILFCLPTIFQMMIPFRLRSLRKDSFYFQAFARNEKGETKGTWKRVGATMQSYPIDGVVETEMVGQPRIGLETSGILKMDGLIIMDWDGFISVQIEKMESGCGEKSMAGYGVIKNLAISSGVTPVATGSTCSFVQNRTRSFLIIPPVDTDSKNNRTKLIKKRNPKLMDGILDILSDLKINRRIGSEADKLFRAKHWDISRFVFFHA